MEYRKAVSDIFRAYPSESDIAIGTDRRIREAYNRERLRLDDQMVIQRQLMFQLGSRTLKAAISSPSSRRTKSGLQPYPVQRASIPCENWNLELGACVNDPCINRRKHGVCSECGGGHKAKDVSSCRNALITRREQRTKTRSAQLLGSGSSRAQGV